MNGTRAASRAEVIAGLSRKDLRNWLIEEAHGGNPLAERYRAEEESPHEAIAAVYECAEHQLRADLDLIVIGLLQQYSPDDAAWSIDGWRELLLTIDPILVDSFHRDTAVTELVSIATFEENAICIRDTIHPECLQALLSLGYKGGVEFWRSAYAAGGSHYSETVAGALCEIEPEAAFKFLAGLPWSDDVETALFGILPHLIDTVGVVSVADLVLRWLRSLPADATELLDDFFAAEGIVLADYAARQRVDDLRDHLMHILSATGIDVFASVDALCGIPGGPYARTDVARGIQSLISSWNFTTDASGPYARNLVRCAGRFPTPESLLVLTALIDDLLRQSTVKPDTVQLVTLCFDAMTTASAFLRRLLNKNADAADMQVRGKILRCLRHALGSEHAGPSALEILASHGDETTTPAVIAAALDANWATASFCDDVLRRYYEDAQARQVMGNAFHEAHKGGRVIAAFKLYQYNDAMQNFTNFTRDTTAMVEMHHKGTPQTAEEFADRIRRAKDLHDG
jgi:hypothetical protein